jgi:molecular chaperone DnaK (HSP70)
MERPRLDPGTAPNKSLGREIRRGTADTGRVARQIIGIDLGTVNSCVATVRDGKAVVLSDGSRTITPSCVSLAGSKEIVGEAAKRRAATDPSTTIVAIKRVLGHPFDSPEVRKAAERLPYPLKASPLGSVLLQVGDRELTPVQVSARILQHLRELAEAALGGPVDGAVIAVPAHFNDVQRKATKLAAEYAGLRVLRLVNEPTAAALAYGYKKARDFTLAVYDLGGGTFDITLMQATGDCFTVVATDGDSFLGGEDIDQAVAEWIEAEFQAQSGSDLAHDPGARVRVRQAAEKAKIELASAESARLELPFLTQLPDGSRPSFSGMLTRAKLEQLARPILERTLKLCERCLKAADVRPLEIDEVLLTGGQARMPLVRQLVRDFFGREPRRDINPDEVVGMGAALYAYSLVVEELKQQAHDDANERLEVALRATDVARKVVEEVHQYQRSRRGDGGGAPRSEEALASRLQELLKQAEAVEEQLLPDRRPRGDADLPQAVEGLHSDLLALDLKAGEVIEKLAADLLEEGDPNLSSMLDQAREVVEKRLDTARGAAEQASQHLEEAQTHARARKVKLRDVTSLPLGIAAVGDVFSMLIDQNCPVPAEHERVFTTQQDDQEEVEIRVHQGHDGRASQNQFLGSFILQGIAAAPRMEPQIRVSFHIDESGILSVRARDARSGAEQGMRVEDPLGLQQANPEGARGPATSIDADGDLDFGAPELE